MPDDALVKRAKGALAPDAVPLDRFGRPEITDDARERIRKAFEGVTGKGALILIGDTETRTVRGHVAANLDGGWKVAAGGGFDFSEKEPFAEFVVMKVW